MEKTRKKTDLIKPLPQEELREEFEPDAHSCRAEADDYGYCTWCGALVYGTSAYYEETASDPPESFCFKGVRICRIL